MGATHHTLSFSNIIAQRSSTSQQVSKSNAGTQPLRLPFIRAIQASGFTNLKDLQSQVTNLQQQLSEVKTENKLLKGIQQRHMTALQHYENAEESLPQVF